MEENGIRINKYLSESGVCSRREADRMIEMGEVTIDDKVAETGDRVYPGQTVLCGGIPATIEEEKILIAFYKPLGIVCTAEKREKDNVIDYINYPKRIYPVGRLDKDSEGLLLLTNQGEIVNKMMRAGNMHEKEYLVTLTRPVTESLIRGLAGGVPLTELGVTTRKCYVKQTGRYSFKIVLTQGYNRQIRRMCEYFGFRVRSLKRVRVMNIELGDLQPGQYRDVTESEYRVLMRLIRDSSNTTVTDAPHKQFRTEKVQRMVDERGGTFEHEPRERREGGEHRRSDRPYEKREDGERRRSDRPYEKREDGERRRSDRPYEKREKKPETPKNPAEKKVYTSNASYSQSSAFEERRRLKEERRKAKEGQELQ